MIELREILLEMLQKKLDLCNDWQNRSGGKGSRTCVIFGRTDLATLQAGLLRNPGRRAEGAEND